MKTFNNEQTPSEDRNLVCIDTHNNTEKELAYAGFWILSRENGKRIIALDLGEVKHSLNEVMVVGDKVYVTPTSVSGVYLNNGTASFSKELWEAEVVSRVRFDNDDEAVTFLNNWEA